MRKLKCDTCRHWLCDCYCGGDGYDPSPWKLWRLKKRKDRIEKLDLMDEVFPENMVRLKHGKWGLREFPWEANKSGLREDAKERRPK